MTKALWAVLAALAALVCVGGACSRAPLSGPPELKPGREECAHCGMLVMEDRFSAAMLVTRDGERLYLFFDDLGCFLDYQGQVGGAGGADVRVHERYVHDYSTRQWVPADGAAYLLGNPDTLPTPMGSGIAGFATRPAAEAAQRELGGDLLDLVAAGASRAASQERRHGTATPAP